MRFVRIILPILLAGCATRSVRIPFRDAAINAKPIALILDTGSDAAYIFDTAAKRLGLPTSPIKHLELNGGVPVKQTAPLHLTVGDAVIDLPIQVYPNSKVATRSLFDAALGWPEVMHNILEFDTAKRVVRRLDSLPSETAGWIRLKVLPRKQLWLEIPLENGATLPVLVDTGSPIGISFPAGMWKKWMGESGLTSAKSRSLLLVEKNAGTIETERVLDAPAIRLGPLRFTHISVEPNLDFPGTQSDSAGKLGILAIVQMDLIVDADGGYAYVRPRPESGPDRFGSIGGSWESTTNWSIDLGVRLRTDRIEAVAAWVSGDAKTAKADYAGAIADYSRSLALEPGDAAVVFDRGYARHLAGDHAGAIADMVRARDLDPELRKNVLLWLVLSLDRLEQKDFDGSLSDVEHALELKPEFAQLYLIRGTARAAKKDFPGAQSDLRRTMELDPTHPERYQDMREDLDRLSARAGN